VVGAYAAYLLTSYLKGLKEESSSEAEAGGRATARWLRDKITGLFEREPDKAAEEASAELQHAIAGTTPAADETMPNLRSDSARVLIEEFLRGQGMPPEAAARLADTVQLPALTLVVPVG
jgi:hypothetical protein